MAKIISIEKNLPHVSFLDLAGNAHVIPKEVFQRILTDKMPLEELEDWREIVFAIIAKWLRGLPEE